MLKVKALMPALVSALAAAAAQAETHCGTEPPLEPLAGSYRVDIGSGPLFGDGRIVPLEASNSFEARLEP